MGLDDLTIAEWFTVCYPQQIRAAISAFSKYSIQEIAQIGMKGARGLKKGIKLDRQKATLSRWNTMKQEREDAIRRKTVTTDIDSLVDEFL